METKLEYTEEVELTDEEIQARKTAFIDSLIDYEENMYYEIW